MRLLPAFSTIFALLLVGCPADKPAGDSSGGSGTTDDSQATDDSQTADDSAPSAEQGCDDGVDNDGDGAYDCDDSDCAADPACMDEDCTNTLDDDGDGKADCEDADCSADPACAPPDEDCANGLDDDGDGATDCDDRDCAALPGCQPVEDCSAPGDEDGDGDPNCLDSDCDNDPACLGGEICGNGSDDDGDGDTDCADTECASDPTCVEDCANAVDDDGDGDTDCADSQCAADPACQEDCADGADNDLDGAADCADTDCDLEPACAEDCTDGADNDGDGLADCDDGACALDPACIVCSEADLGSSYGSAVASGDTTGQGNDRDPSCAYNPGSEDVIYRWVAPASGLWSFDTVGSSFDTLLAIEVNACGTDTECNDDTDGTTSYVASVLTAGDTVYIVVDGYNGEGAYVLNINLIPESLCEDGSDDDGDGATDCDDTDCAADPACVPEAICDDGADDDEDGATDCDDTDCAAAFVCGSACTDDHLGRAWGLILSEDTAGMGDDAAPTCGSGEDQAWSWTAPADATWTFNASGGPALALYQGDCSGTEIACDATPLSATLSATLSEGETIVLVVDGAGAYDLYATPDREIDCGDGLDDDADGATDCDDADCAAFLLDWYPDADGDRFGEDAGATAACAAPAGYVPDGGDCDDADPMIHPYRYDDPANGLDDDCDGAADAADTDVPTAYVFNDDDSAEHVFSSFSFDFCGATYGSVYVGSNGILAFDGALTDYNEDAADFTGPGSSPSARVAGLWDDLYPPDGGTIEVIEYADAVGVYYRAVPEIGTGNLNTFSVLLRADGRILTEYDGVTVTDGLAGWSCGTGSAADTADISADRAALSTAAGIGRGTEDALYELFTAGNDLSGLSVPWCVQSGSDDDGDGTTGACGDQDDPPGI